jgi:hypothetical protein
LKYAPGSVGPKNPDLQKWKFASSAVAAVNQSSYAVSCAAYPGKVLQPAGSSTGSGVAVVLGDRAPSHSPTIVPNPWKVVSPLLPAPGKVSV